VIHTLSLLPTLIEPCCGVVGITGLRHGHEVPKLVATAGIKSAGVSRALSLRDFPIRGPQNNNILVHKRHTAPVHARIDKAHCSESGIGLSRVGIERKQPSSNHCKNARGMSRVPGPIGYTAR
jgi:hypothetical protein